MKKTSRFDRTGKEKDGKKLPYEKPKVESLKLFADQVLSTCSKESPLNPLCIGILESS